MKTLVLCLIILIAGLSAAYVYADKQSSNQEKRDTLHRSYGSYGRFHLRCSYVMALKGTTIRGLYDDPMQVEPVWVPDKIMLDCMQIYSDLFHPGGKIYTVKDLDDIHAKWMKEEQ